MKTANYYKALGIKRNATAREIKRAYRKLVLLYHPDKLSDESDQLDQFRKIQEAYNTLINPDLKKSYNQKIDREKVSEREQDLIPIYNPENLIISIGTRKLIEGESFMLSIQSFVGHNNIKLIGNPGFRITDGPYIRHVNDKITQISYRILPLQRGRSILGPASVIYQDKKIVSSAILMVVNRPPTPKEIIKDRWFQRVITYIGILFLTVVTTIIAYNYIKNDLIKYDNFAYDRHVYMHEFRPVTGIIPYEADLKLPAIPDNYFNRVEIEGLSTQDAVVFLINAKNEAIQRVRYVRAKEYFAMDNLPNGNYYLIIYAGRFWDPNEKLYKTFNGAFKKRVALTSYNIDKYKIVLEQIEEENNTFSHSIYKVPLRKLTNGIPLKKAEFL